MGEKKKREGGRKTERRRKQASIGKENKKNKETMESGRRERDG